MSGSARTTPEVGQNRARWVLGLAPAGLYLFTAIALARRTVADSYDGVGFVLALQRLDLVHFQPQPPGYPLFVALGRLVQACGVPPAVALSLICAVLLGAGISAVATAIARREGRLTGALCAVFLTLAPLCFALGIATLSDAAGLGALLLAVAVLVRGGRGAYSGGGALIGVALGIRPTYAPLAALLVLAVGAKGMRALWTTAAGALAAVLCWLCPFALIVGPQTLWTVCRDHVLGHFTDFGGAMTADPTPGIPVVALLHGLVDSALGPGWPLGALLLGAALVLRPPRSLLPETRRLMVYLLVGIVGYAVWTLIALPVHGHARHLLPAVVALLVLFAVIMGTALQTAGPRARRALGLGCVLLVGTLAATSARTIWAFRQPSPGVALAQYVATHYPKGTLLYGARAARFVDLHWGSGSARPTTQLGNVTAEVERLDRLPAEILITSEVVGSAASIAALRPIARFCYDPHLPWVLHFSTYPDGCVELRAQRFRR